MSQRLEPLKSSSHWYFDPHIVTHAGILHRKLGELFFFTKHLSQPTHHGQYFSRHQPKQLEHWTWCIQSSKALVSTNFTTFGVGIRTAVIETNWLKPKLKVHFFIGGKFWQFSREKGDRHWKTDRTLTDWFSFGFQNVNFWVPCFSSKFFSVFCRTCFS